MLGRRRFAPGEKASGSARRSSPNARRLQGEYTLNARAHRVDARIGFGHVIDPYRAIASSRRRRRASWALSSTSSTAAPTRSRSSGLAFRGYDERGRPLPAGTQSTPLRRSMPDRPVRGQVLTQIIGFTVPRGRRLALIRMSSIVDVWRFRARWTLPR